MMASLLVLLTLARTALALEATAFDVHLDLPNTAQVVSSASTSDGTRAWTDPGDGTVWTVERRGDGSGKPLPTTLQEAASMMANAFGDTTPGVPKLTRVGGAEAATVTFDVPPRAGQSWVFLHGGYLYAVSVMAPRTALGVRADHLARTTTLTPSTVRSHSAITLAQLGLDLPGAADLAAGTITGPIAAMALLDPPARAGLIVARMPSATSAYAGTDATKIGEALSREGCAGAAPRASTFGGLPAWEARCSRADGHGTNNLERIVIVTKGADTYLIRAITDPLHANQLDAWTDRRLGGARVVR